MDFKGALDSVDHDILWAKLQKVGLSTKFINIVSRLYSKANVKVSDGKINTIPIDLTRGVLQGETLSILLFALFIYDLEKFLLRNNIRGVWVTHLLEILLLAYADDIAILSDSYIGMKKILEYLSKYCLINKLTINVKKTKIVLFQKKGHGHKQ